MTRFPATRLESVTRTFVVAQGAGSAARALDARRTLARSGPAVSAKHAGTHRRFRASLTPRVGENKLSPPVRPVSIREETNLVALVTEILEAAATKGKLS